MTRKLKVLGLTLVAVFAMSVVAAQGAQAAIPKIHYPGGQTAGVLTGEQEAGTVDRFTVPTFIGTATVECKKAKFDATAAEGAEEVTVTPTYSECTFNGEAATVTTNHCAYIFKKAETSAAGHAPVKVECAAGSAITVATSVCTMSIGEQDTPPLTGGVHYTNVGGHVTIKSTVENIEFTKTGSGCGFIIGNKGKYFGEETVKAFEDKGTPLTGTEKTTPVFKEGAEIPVEVLNP